MVMQGLQNFSRTVVWTCTVILRATTRWVPWACYPSEMDYRRSPRYPAVSLSKAINGAHLLWTKNLRTAVQGEELAKVLGYESHSGPSRTLIGAMRQYGLFEKQDGGIRLSRNAKLIICSAEGSREQIAAIREAALTPHLFQDLYATHRGEPEEAIESYLTLRRGFAKPGAALAASAYCDTLSYAKLTGSAYHSGNSAATDKGEMPRRSPANELDRGIASSGVLSRIGQKWGDSLLTQTLVVSIPRNFKVDVSVYGDQIKKEDLARIKNQFDRWIESLEDVFE
jgi:hypothetical protein